MSELTFQDPKKKFCEELKEAREFKGLDLSRVSEKSKISLPYLEKLEAGDWDFLPHPYVRSFLRTYALIVGLEVGKVLDQFDNIVDEPPVPVPGVFEDEEGSPLIDPRPKKPVKKKKKEDEVDEGRKPLKFSLAGDSSPSASTSTRHSGGGGRKNAGTAWIIGAVVVVLIVSGILLWPDGNTDEPVAEIPFDQVVAEHERDAGAAVEEEKPAESTPQPTTTPVAQPATTQQDENEPDPTGTDKHEEAGQDEEPAESVATTSDSLVTGLDPNEPLVLYAEALQKCYLKVTADEDSLPMSDIVLDPGMTRRYEADSLLTVVLGNAAGMSLKLGDAELGELGEEGRVVTVYIGREGIRRIRNGILRQPEPEAPSLDTLDLTRPVGRARDSINAASDSGAQAIPGSADSIEDTTGTVTDTSATGTDSTMTE
ncbi:helix-turn-helix domain-containing protein [bacterium]|nr:helix-turn-helix domain-containing protein [bacterium]